ncbi:MAG: hypothetical protein H0W64_11550 [Gammaproteobacteria bacterium]|nr:hypothetical protein [Gammaproteobacteria bacterium]
MSEDDLFSTAYEKLGNTAKRLSHNPVGICTFPVWLPPIGLGYVFVGTAQVITYAVVVLPAVGVYAIKEGIEDARLVHHNNRKFREANPQFRETHPHKHSGHLHRFFCRNKPKTIEQQPVYRADYPRRFGP